MDRLIECSISFYTCLCRWGNSERESPVGCCHARVDVFDVNGRLVKSLFNGVAKEGANEVFWNGTDETSRQVASGVYFYRLNANLQDFSKKMVVVRQGGQ